MALPKHVQDFILVIGQVSIRAYRRSYFRIPGSDGCDDTIVEVSNTLVESSRLVDERAYLDDLRARIALLQVCPICPQHGLSRQTFAELRAELEKSYPRRVAKRMALQLREEMDYQYFLWGIYRNAASPKEELGMLEDHYARLLAEYEILQEEANEDLLQRWQDKVALIQVHGDDF